MKKFFFVLGQIFTLGSLGYAAYCWVKMLRDTRDLFRKNPTY